MARYYKCDNCGEKFLVDEASKLRTSYEDYYGVSHLFSHSTSLICDSCPYCGNESLEEFEAYECLACGKIIKEDCTVSYNKKDFCIDCAVEILSKYSLETLEKFCVSECEYALDIFNANKHLSIRECLEALVKYDKDIIFDYAYFIEKGDY